MLPLVSILITTYNQPKYFVEALESALNQDYPNVEIIIGDDSTDNRTEEIVSKYLATSPKFPIEYFHHKHRLGGKGFGNLNFVMERAHGEFVNFLHDDDLFASNKISRMIDWFLREDVGDRIAFVSSNQFIIDSESRVVDIYKALPNFDEDFICISGEAFGRECLKGCGNFAGELTTNLFRRENLLDLDLGKFFIGKFFDFYDKAMRDISTWLELARHQDRICVFLKEPLSSFRSHQIQLTNDVDARFNYCCSFAALTATSRINGVFVNDDSIFEQSLLSWLDLLDETTRTSANYKSPPDPRVTDLLANLAESIQNHDYDRFLEFARK